MQDQADGPRELPTSVKARIAVSAAVVLIGVGAVLVGCRNPVNGAMPGVPVGPPSSEVSDGPTTTTTGSTTLPAPTTVSTKVGPSTKSTGGGGAPPAPGSPRGCALPAFPTPGCTGVPGGIALTTVKGDLEATTPGQVIDRQHITGNLLVAADNVVITNSQIDGRVANDKDSRTFAFTISDSTVGSSSGCDLETGIGADKFTATRVSVRGHGDGFGVSGNNVVIQDSFVNLCGTPDAHSDGVQGYLGGTNVTIRHNTIDQRHVPESGVTAPVFISDGSKDATVVNNLLMGGSETIRVHNGGGHYVVTGNRVVDNAWVYGPVNSDCGAISTWSDNRLVTIDNNYNVTSLGAVLPCS